MKIQVNNYLPIVDFGKNIDKTIFLSSSARSGSTFFANLLNYNKKYRILFEPLSKNHVAKAKELDFPTYLNEDDDNLLYKDFFHDIVSGHVSNPWIDRENKAGIYSKRLVKEVRSNLLLPWVLKNFPEIKTVLLLRNPLSVINSWHRVGFEDGFLLRDLVLKQKDFLEKMPKHILDAYLLEKDSFLLSIYYWCITNNFPIKNCDSNSILVVKYEDVVLKMESTIEAIYSFTGIDISNVPDRVFSKFSSSSRFRKDDSFKRLNKIKESLGREQLEKADSIMECFEISHLYKLNLKD